MKAIEKLMVIEEDRAYCQPCLSPIWDTSLAAHALLEVGDEAAARLKPASDWMRERQVLDVVGDWAAARPDVRPGGWAFQYNNAHYPDVDDTAVVVMALDRIDAAGNKEAIERGAEWILGLQSKNGGWGSFDADNEYYYLNHIPFADHGALLDPPTADVSARCLGMLAQLGYKMDDPRVKAAVDYLLREQEPEGCWFGRWGTNYIYGTWSVLAALNAIGLPPSHPAMMKAVAWLRSKQRPMAAGARAATAIGRRSPAARDRSRRRRKPPGRARLDGGGRGRPPRRRSVASSSSPRHRLSTASGTRTSTPRSASRACSICAITVIARSSRSGPWRATAT